MRHCDDQNRRRHPAVGAKAGRISADDGGMAAAVCLRGIAVIAGHGAGRRAGGAYTVRRHAHSRTVPFYGAVRSVFADRFRACGVSLTVFRTALRTWEHRVRHMADGGALRRSAGSEGDRQGLSCGSYRQAAGRMSSSDGGSVRPCVCDRGGRGRHAAKYGGGGMAVCNTASVFPAFRSFVFFCGSSEGRQKYSTQTVRNSARSGKHLAASENKKRERSGTLDMQNS